MAKKDYYEILGLARDCSSEDVKKSYHRLALKWHPDKNSNKKEAEMRFNEIHKAYTILGNKAKRKTYDRFGHEGLELEDECIDLAKNNIRNKYYQKGFQGTDKSAFDILRGIFQNDDDEEFFANFDSYGISQTLQRTMRAFINNNIISSDDDDDSFCENYIPTFMNSDFNLTPSVFPKQEFCHQGTTHEYFSFTSVDSNGKCYSKTKKTVVKNGKVKTSTKERYQNGDEIMENTNTNEYELNNQPDPVLDDKTQCIEGLNKNSKAIRKEKPAEKKTPNKKGGNRKSATK